MNPKRWVVSLNGLWDFAFVDLEYKPVLPLVEKQLMGVPGSYNDVFTTQKAREYVGKVCYERLIYIPDIQEGLQYYIRFGAAAHKASVYLDGELVMTHLGGFLPFDVKVEHPKSSMRLTVLLDNRLDYQSLPMGELIENEGVFKQKIYFDFFNYSGLHRDVWLYKLPLKQIKEITIKTMIQSHEAHVFYDVTTLDVVESVEIKDPKGKIYKTQNRKKDILKIEEPILWDIHQGNLYTLIVKTQCDHYEQTFGIREIYVKDQQLYLNHKPIFLKGFGMHEDHEIIGKGTHPLLHIRDFELLKWIGANSIRTSHYPYDEQMYDLADQYGILIIDEIPAVGLNFWDSRTVFQEDRVNEQSLDIYKQTLKALVERDKNHPSVIMYSLANEANTYESGAVHYFEEAFKYARTLTDLPLMIVENVNAEINLVAQFADVIGLNRYHGWYTDFSDLSVIEKQLKDSFTSYLEKFHKPIVLTEFGADTIAGLHTLPAQTFSEEFQVEFIEAYLNVANHTKGVIGTHIWNFADFQTKQGLTRFNGNKKGVFTRNREPKMVAHMLRIHFTKEIKS